MTELLSHQSPLAPVWLAANYDKKLTKHQLLSANIVRSSALITTNDVSSTLNLRLSGQLLLGIVRIYSRKTKYLLDDVNDILFRLKNSFRYATGVVSDASHVTALPQNQVITNISSITLQDQVTDLNLLYQEDLRLDDDEPATLFRELNLAYSDDTMDTSIEYGRNAPTEAADNDDLDLNLDFDMDQSVEIGRDAHVAAADMSLVDLHDDVNFDFSEPLQTLDEEQATPAPAKSGPRATRSLRRVKRKLVVDDQDEVEQGLSIQELKRLLQLQLRNLTVHSFDFHLSDHDKVNLIHELSANKRRRFNIDAQLKEVCEELAVEEQQARAVVPEPHFEFGGNVDLDISLPDIDLTSKPVQNAHTTVQIAHQLREAFEVGESVEFTEVVDADMNSATPLGMIDETTINKRREASKCFFEILVLATNNCISVDNDLSITKKENIESMFL